MRGGKERRQGDERRKREKTRGGKEKGEEDNKENKEEEF